MEFSKIEIKLTYFCNLNFLLLYKTIVFNLNNVEQLFLVITDDKTRLNLRSSLNSNVID